MPGTCCGNGAATLLSGGSGESFNEKNRRWLLFFCGRLEKPKGLQTILPLFARTGRKLLVAGAGTFEAELRDIAGNAPAIQFLGRVPHSELSDLYRQARATVVPSICYETFGLVPLESIRNRTPAIVSNFGALPEMISATGGGAVYRNAEELERLLVEFDADPAAAGNLGNTGFDWAQKYSEQEHLRAYFQLIEDAR